MIEKYVLMDRRQDNFYARFVEQRIQKLSNPEQLGLEISIPFPIEPLSTFSTALSRKRISNTSSDSGVNSPHVLSPVTSVPPDNSQPYLMPSSSRTTPPSGIITPIQQFIQNSQESKNKEPK